jgi:hypothetical protein
MTNDLPVPPELQHLIEKRELADRRKKQRRSDRKRRTANAGLDDQASVPKTKTSRPNDRRAGRERRRATPRRQAARRKTDAAPDGASP